MKAIGLYVVLAFVIWIWLQRVTACLFRRRAPKEIIRRIARLGQLEADPWVQTTERLSRWMDRKMPVVQGYGLERRVTLQRKLDEVGAGQKAEVFLMKKVAYAGRTLGVGMLLAALTRDVQAVSYFFVGCGVLFSVVVYRAPDHELVKLKQKRDELLVLELPRFIRTIRYSPENKPLVAIVRDYLKIAKVGLREALEGLLCDLELNVSEDKALQRFSDRIRSSEVREMVAVLRITLNMSRKESLMSLMFIEDKLTEKARRLVQRDLERRPEILETLNDVLLYALGLIFLVPMGITMFKGLSAFMG